MGNNLKDKCYKPRTAKHMPDTKDLNIIKLHTKPQLTAEQKTWSIDFLNDSLCKNMSSSNSGILQKTASVTFCNKKPETVVHLSWSYEPIQSFGGEFSNDFWYGLKNIVVDKEVVFLGTKDSFLCFNIHCKMLCVFFKYKETVPQVDAFVQHINHV